MSTVIDGKALAAKLRGQIRERAEAFRAERGFEIGLAVVLVGEDPASQVYVRNKIKACEEAGIRSFSYHLPAASVTSGLLSKPITSQFVYSRKAFAIEPPMRPRPTIPTRRELICLERRYICGRIGKTRR